jgi:predicted nucleotidyltransferase
MLSKGYYAKACTAEGVEVTAARANQNFMKTFNRPLRVDISAWQSKGSYNFVMSMTALDLPPEALEKYRPLEAIRRRRTKMSAEISKRRRRAHAAARKAAKLLRDRFGATEIMLFGSLAGRVGFTRWSDIDLAARGIPSEQYLTAMDTVLHLSAEFKIDLVDLETCPPALLKSIERDGKPL